ncbi:MAG: hypothetical protein J5725_08275 [Bacteroidales bacterium]|nr:hypothetical protein [Bacteroidales bacterium]
MKSLRRHLLLLFSMFFFIGITAYATTPTSYSTTNWSEVSSKLSSYDIVHYTGNPTISSNFTIPAGKTLIITGNVTLSKTLTVNGDLLIEGNLTMSSGSSHVVVSKNSVVLVKHKLMAGNNACKVSLQSSADGSVFGTFMVGDTLDCKNVTVSFANNGMKTEAFYVSVVKKADKVDEDYTKGETAHTNGDNLLKDMGLLGLLPIRLSSFTVSATTNGYTFHWVTASEVENDYFTLEFSENGEEFIAIDYIHGAGTTSQTSEYEYRWDAKPTADILYFRLKQTDYNGEFTYSDILVYAPKKSHGANRILYYGPLKLNVVDGQLQYIVE